MSFTKLLVISPACHTAINRNVYKQMNNYCNYNITLIIPNKMRFNKRLKSPEPIEYDDPEIVFLSTIFSSNPRFQLFIGLFKQIIKNNPDVILLDLDPLCLQALTLGVFCKIYKIKFYCISCENISIDFFETINRKGYKSFFALMVKHFFKLCNKKLLSGVFTISNEGTRIYNNLGFNEVIKIPLGFDSQYFKVDQISREKVRLDNEINGIVIAYFGRFVYEKGIHILIKSLSELKEIEWTLVMDEFKDYESDYIKEIVELLKSENLISRVKFINPSHKEMGLFLNAVDIVVVPSIRTNYWEEQYGRIIPEALACGKLVIASNTGAIPMLIDKYGILFREGDICHLTTILKDVLVNEKLPDDSEQLMISKYANENLSIESQIKIMSNKLN